MDKLRLGLIGCGKFAKGTQLPNCKKAGNIELYACNCINNEEKKVAEEFGPKKITSDYKKLLSDKNVDMVLLCVPHELHMFFIEEALKAGKHVLCEKPMAMTMDECYKIIRLVKKAGVKLCVDYNRRFSPSMIDMKKAYHANRNATKRKPPRIYTQEKSRQAWAEEEVSSMLIRINDESLTYGGVHIDWKEGGGEIIGEGCHWLDLMSWMLEDRPVRITGVGSARLHYILSIEFANGSLGCIQFSANGTFEYPKELIEIQDHGKLFRSECFVENQYWGRSERTIKKFPLEGDCYPAIGAQGGHSGYLEKIDAAGTDFVKKGTFNYSSPNKGHLGLLQAFADAIIKDKPSPIDEMAGMRATYLCLRAMESIRTGVSMPINIEEWDMYVH